MLNRLAPEGVLSVMATLRQPRVAGWPFYNPMSAGVGLQHLRGVVVKRHCRILVLFLLAGVFGGSAVLRVDAPETAFNESDAPVNLALPAQTPLRFVRPVSDSIVIPAGVVSIRVLGAPAMPTPCHPHSLQELLSTFLI